MTLSFFFNDTATTEIYTLSLHDALPICQREPRRARRHTRRLSHAPTDPRCTIEDRKSTRLNSSHTVISYAVFCLKKKRIRRQTERKHMYNTLFVHSWMPQYL